MSALDELARYLGHPDRPFDARALELVSQAVRERNGDLPRVGHVGDDLDMPFAPAAPGTTLDVSQAVVCGGVTVAAVAVPLDGGVLCPGLVFTFSRYDGQQVRPVLLVNDHEQMHRVPRLVLQAVLMACQAVRR